MEAEEPHTANDMVKDELMKLVSIIHNNNDMVGEQVTELLRLPFKSSDARVLTWKKLVKFSIAEKIVNNPQSKDDCWYIMSNNKSGGKYGAGYVHQIKLDGKGEKWQTHRIMHLLCNPSDWKIIGNKGNADTTKHVAHRCAHGRSSEPFGSCCINPFHTVLVDDNVNQDHKGCTYGCAKLCPHTPKCIFTWKHTGLTKPCFNDPHLYPPNECSHTPKCTH